MKERWKKAGMLFLFFIKIGAFTFGGGWSILAQMQKEFVEKRGWITGEELIDITSVGRSLPGIMITNITMLFGYHMGGVPCAAAATLGMVIPPFFILTVITFCYNYFRSSVFVTRVLVGIRAAVVPIIASSAFALRKSALKDLGGYLIAAGAFILCLFLKANNVLIVLLGGLCGLILMGVRNRDST